MGTERSAYGADILFGAGEIREYRASSHILTDPLERDGFDQGPRVVQNETAERRLRERAQHHADEPSHGGAHPMHLLDVKPGDQRDAVRDIGGYLVLRRVGEPVAFTASRIVRTDYSVTRHEGSCQVVEVAAGTRQPVGTHDDAVRRRVTPLVVGKAMDALRCDA